METNSANRKHNLLERVLFHMKQNNISLPDELMEEVEREVIPTSYQNPNPHKVDNRKWEVMREINPEQLLLQDETLLNDIAHIIRARNHILSNDDTGDKIRDTMVISVKDIILMQYLIGCIKRNADTYLELLAEGCAINFACDACSLSYKGICPKMTEAQAQRTLRVQTILRDVGVYRPQEGDREIKHDK